MPSQPGKVKGVADIVFLLDVTGSMQPCIDALKDNISMFIDTLSTRDANNSSPVQDWRCKVVGYRDFEVDSEPFIDNPFVRNPDDLKRQLRRLTAEGGGDEPESLLDALYKLATAPSTEKGAPEDPYKWRYRSEAARVVVIFTDATYKEEMALPEVRGGGFDDVVNAIMPSRIILSVFAPDMPCYDRLCEIDKCEYEAITVNPSERPQDALARFTSDQDNFKRTMEQLGRSVSASVATEILGGMQ